MSQGQRISLKTRSGFTLLEILLVMMVIVIIMGLLFSVYNVMLNSYAADFNQAKLYQSIYDGLSQLEDRARAAVSVNITTTGTCHIIDPDGTTEYILSDGSEGGQLSVSQNRQGASSNFVLLSSISTTNSSFFFDPPFFFITLNAVSGTDNIIRAPYSVTVATQVRLRNRRYAQNSF